MKKLDQNSGKKTKKGGKTPTGHPIDPSQTPSLTPKQQLFVIEYLVDLNATRAALRAGYSAKTAGKSGPENMTKPVIKAAIEAAMAERAKRVNVTADSRSSQP